MSITAFTVIKNGNKLGYPWLESILCVLPYVDRFVIGEGYSDDDTSEWLSKLQHRCGNKIVLFHQKWPKSVTGFSIGTVTNSCMDLARKFHSDWLWLVQSDELYRPESAEAMRWTMDHQLGVDGLLVPFLHLQNNYQEVQQGAGYEIAIRAVLNRPSIRSYRDAWTFEGCWNALPVTLPSPVVHANRTYWHNIPRKIRSHADTLYPDLSHYRASAEAAERLHQEVEIPALFTQTDSPFSNFLPDIIKPTIGWLEYQPREELLA